MNSAGNYISICRGIIDFHSAHKSRIDKVDGLEVHFMDLHMLLIDLENEYKEAFKHLLPLLKEKEAEKRELEKLLVKLSKETNTETLSAKPGKGKKKTEEISQVPGAGMSTAEIAEQYNAIISRSRNLDRKDLQSIETRFTRFVLAIPVYHLIEEKMEQVSQSKGKTISNIEYLLHEHIDLQMDTLKTVNPGLYKLYQDIRQPKGKRPQGKTKNRKASGSTAWV